MNKKKYYLTKSKEQSRYSIDSFYIYVTRSGMPCLTKFNVTCRISINPDLFIFCNPKLCCIIKYNIKNPE